MEIFYFFFRVRVLIVFFFFSFVWGVLFCFLSSFLSLLQF